MFGSSLEILLVDNDQSNIENTKNLFKEIKIRNNLNIVENSASALAYLEHQAAYQQARQPAILMIDRELSQREDDKLLMSIQANANFNGMIVVMLLRGDAHADMSAFQAIRFKHYLKKPLNVQSIVSVLKRTDDLWISIVRG